MALIKTPIKGTNDFLPYEKEIREYVLGRIRTIYSSFGFTEIETPVMEHIENLTGGHGGENEKLIFKILKRGEKLSKCEDLSDAADSGLRFDLTLPLARYYANCESCLYSPFKAMQIGNVFRADRPQKGRFRQFTQCDIDILGDDSNLAETELILATSTLLKDIGFKDFTVRINDRKILKETAEKSGVPEELLSECYIILDKTDKIGREGVLNELLSLGLSEETAKKYLEAQNSAEMNDNLKEIVSNIEASGADGFKVIFDPTLVRGMGYYTGTIFEITMDELGLSVAGGGRYDDMIGRFGGPSTPACGFSIGFERIMTILKDRNFKLPGEKNAVCFLIDKKAAARNIAAALKEATELRKNGTKVTVTKRNKNVKFQKESLSALGYTEFKEIF